MRFRVDIEGVAELDAQLERLGKAVATELGEKAVRGSAKLLQEAWVAAAPFSPVLLSSTGDKKYGHLRDNIKVRKLPSHKARRIVYSVSTGHGFWGNFIELGTYNIPARPWARPVFDRLSSEIVATQISILREGIDAEVSGSRKFGKMLPNGRNA